MNVIKGLVDRWKSVTTDFERDMNAFLIDFERFFEGTDELALKGKEEECEDGGKRYKVGQSWTDEAECNLKVCHPRKVISVRKCPEWVAPPNCREQNRFKSKQFPDCCPLVICPMQSHLTTSQ